ncbi:ABC-type nitrate/sulfonate/bicarbonate transport system, permease component [Xenococcus sp. PCC 7305]|uniref:ABC transporter permease n=1 Tax=Xenococcus sp. PCC 7305 TaxID=102125 RepID=UPI0002AC80B1|nr:ABC transporter permease [Xenococcus sp. PCC 7305]ELS03521.1 ABC-type nitrate/sulfonate/bicarbonate transport system, permease component [Xenococcus sp. PCC 7305]
MKSNTKKEFSRQKISGIEPTVFWRIAEDIPKSLSWGMMGFSILIPLLCWFLFATYSGVNPTFLPSPSDVIDALVRLWQKGFLTKDIAASFTRVTIGFFLSTLVAIPLGIMMGSFASIRSLFEPIIGIVRYMPAPAFIPLLIIYLGIDEPPKIALIFIGTLFFNVLMIMDAVKFIPKDLIETTYTLGGSRWQVLSQVITPYIIPSMLDAFRVNMAASWNLVVVAELLAASEGLGKRILLAQKFLKTDEIFACLIVLGLIGFALDLSFRLFLRLTCKWALD